jgi:arginyl-tRNA synthetase
LNAGEKLFAGLFILNMNFEEIISAQVKEAFSKLFNRTIDQSQMTFQPTRKEFEGDITLVVFPLARISGKSPEETGNALGNYLAEHCDIISSFNLVKGFLNLVIHDSEWLKLFLDALNEKSFGIRKPDASPPVLVEYSSPNTNKPLHLGHVRNNLIGFSVAEILKANGKNVVMVNLVNDRGIHICKSMLAWQKFGNDETPASSGIKGDHLVGKYYVIYDKHYKEEMDQLISAGRTKEQAAKEAPLMMEAQEMLRKWEAGDEPTLALWKKMNEWVYEGFTSTYENLGVRFDKFYYESETYLLGKKLVETGLNKGAFFKKEDGSVWVDLTDEGLDQKLLLRSDGTSVYITQDIGTANLRYSEFNFDKLIYVVANEQDYHFKVLKLVLKKLGFPWWENLFHLNYGMVDLPTGKMKSREGTVVDADELMKEMVDTARDLTRQLGKIEGFTEEEAEALYHTIGMGALKYYILKVDPDKRMLFNPAESIDFNGNTGPFIQYTYARIRSVLRKAAGIKEMAGYMEEVSYEEQLPAKEKDLIKTILRFKDVVAEAGHRNSPALIANFTYELVKSYNQFYHEHSIIDQQNISTSVFRLRISWLCGQVIKSAAGLLGISVPERM